MKLIAKVCVLGLLVLLPVSAMAAEFRTGEDLVVRGDAPIAGDVYFAAANTFLSGSVDGDALGVSGNVTVSGDVSGDLLSLGGNVHLLGSVGDDARLVGGTVQVHGSVEGDLVGAAGQMYVGPSSRIGGDIAVAGGNISLDGEVLGDAEVYGEQVVVNGTIKGDVWISGGKVRFGETAVVEGNLSYKSKTEATFEEGSQILGTTDFEKIDYGKPDKGRESSNLWGWIFGTAVLKFLMWVVGALILTLMFQSRIRGYAETALSGFWKEAGRGFLVLVATPIAAILLLVTVIGIPLGILAFLSYGTVLLFAKMLSGVVAGSLIFKLFKKSDSYEVSWISTIAGILILSLVGWIPVVGWIVTFLFCLAAIGALVKHCHAEIWKKA